MTRIPFLLLPLALLAACDRAPKAPKAAAPPAAGSEPAAAGTVALSGAIADLPPATTPDATRVPTDANKPAAIVEKSARPPPPVRMQPATDSPEAEEPAESEAMRAFREAQARRDRELLERDMDASRRDAGPAPPRYEDEELDPMAGQDGPPLDEYPPEDELPPDDDYVYDPEDPVDEPLPPDDDELVWDPSTGTWR